MTETLNQIAERRGIATEIDTWKFPSFKLAVLTKDSAIYINPGDDILVIDIISKAVMSMTEASKRYVEAVKEIVNAEKPYEYADAYFIEFLKRAQLSWLT